MANLLTIAGRGQPALNPILTLGVVPSTRKQSPMTGHMIIFRELLCSRAPSSTVHGLARVTRMTPSIALDNIIVEARSTTGSCYLQVLLPNKHRTRDAFSGCTNLIKGDTV